MSVRCKLSLMFSVCCAIACALVAPGLWADYPAANTTYLNDYVNKLSQGDTAALRQMLSTAHSESGVEARVVIIDSISDYAMGDRDIESFATNLFNTWGVGDAERNQGILMVLALGDRQVRIELGDGYSAESSQQVQKVIDRQIVPRLKQGDVSGAVHHGMRATLSQLADWHLTSESPAPVKLKSSPRHRPSNPATVPTSPRSQALWWVGGIATFLSSIFGGRWWLRYRRRKCPQCSAAMRRRDELTEDEHLEQDQQVEETLGSVDYDVWCCTKCPHTVVVPFRALFSSYKTCPHCAARTLSKSSATTRTPTQLVQGEERHTEFCRHCDYHHSYTTVIAYVDPTTSHSSSGGSFGGGGSSGGGSSSGGGASGSW